MKSDLPTGIVTFLFTDIEGSTKLWEEHPEAMKAALARHDLVLRRVIESNGGCVFKTVGDAFCAAFAFATDALTAALMAQRALFAEAWGETPITVRIALHTGVAQERAGDYFGQPLNRVARLLSAAHGGQTLLSRATQELVLDSLPLQVELRDLGERRLKDLIRPERIFQLVAPDLPADFPPLRTLDSRPNNLPVQATLFIGRELETADVRQRILRPETRLLTLTGPGGTGKTRLGLQVAAELLDEFTDGVFFVPLAPISDPAFVVVAIAQVLGLRDVGGRSPLVVLKDDLRDKRLLLILDNFEQVAEAAPVVGELLAAAFLLKVLVTSRAVLHVYGEYVYPVPSLRLPDPEHLPPLEQLSQYEAVRLFVERTLAVRSDFALTDRNAAAVTKICSRLDGLPLAIELAAARGKVLSPQALLTRLERRLPLLTGGARDLAARQQTLRSSLAWSYDLLNGGEKTLFRRLAVFVGGCTLEAAERVCSVGDDLPVSVLGGLESLVDKSLLKQEEASGEPYFTMLETIREYALEQLEASGEWQEMKRRHAECFLALAERAEPELRGPDQIEWLKRLEAAHPNVRAALAWALEHAPETALRLAGTVGVYWEMHNYVDEGLSWLRQALQVDQGTLPVCRAKVLSRIGGLTWQSGDPTTARRFQEESIALYRTLGEAGRRGLAETLSLLGITCVFQGDLVSAESASEESVALFRTLEDRSELALALATLAKTGIGRRDSATVRAQHEESIALFREVGDRWGLAIPLTNLAILLHIEGEDERASSLAEESVTLLTEVGDQSQRAIALIVLAQVRHTLGDYAEAIALYDEAMEAYRRMGLKSGTAAVLYHSGNVTLAQGDYARAARLFQSSLELYREEHRQAGMARCFAGFGAVVTFQGNATLGARLLGKAEAMREAVQGEVMPTERTMCGRAVAAARTQLGEAVFSQAWDEGRSMTMEQAMACVLGHPIP